MAEQTPEVQKIVDIIQQLEELKGELYQQYSRTVDLVIAGEITEKADIEKVLDSLLDFGDDERFYVLFRKLCRHVYTKHPDTAVEYVNIFRMMFGDDED